MWATALAITMLVANLVGMGLGPQIVGLLSDWMAPAFGNDSLRYAMLMLSFLGLWAAYHFWAAGTTVMRDLAATEESLGRVFPEHVSEATAAVGALKMTPR